MALALENNAAGWKLFSNSIIANHENLHAGAPRRRTRSTGFGLLLFRFLMEIQPGEEDRRQLISQLPVAANKRPSAAAAALSWRTAPDPLHWPAHHWPMIEPTGPFVRTKLIRRLFCLFRPGTTFESIRMSLD